MPRCFKKGNAANCSFTERLAASRKYGIVRREKYNARPAELTTTFTTLGLSYSSELRMRVAAVDISAPPWPGEHRTSNIEHPTSNEGEVDPALDEVAGVWSSALA